MKLIPYFCATCALLTLLQIAETKIIKRDKYAVMKDENLASTKVFQNELDCRVRQTYSIENWLGEPLRFMAFIEHGERLSTSIGFQYQHIDLVYDKWIISQNEITLFRVRNGVVNKTTTNQHIDTAGWTWIEILMVGRQFILKYENTTALNYTVDQPVNKLNIHGNYISICLVGSPTWMIEKGKYSKIPLFPSRQAVNQCCRRNYVITLQSDNNFTPCFRVDGYKTCLEYENNVITSAGSMKPSPLRAGIWDLNLEVFTESININHKIDGEQKNVISFSKHGMKFIEVTSNYSTFSVSLNVFVQPEPSSHLTVLDIDVTTDDTQPGIKSEIYMVIGILIGIALSGFLMVVVFVISRRQRFTSALKTEYKNIDPGVILHDLKF